jgi:hypothetical protein
MKAVSETFWIVWVMGPVLPEHCARKSTEAGGALPLSQPLGRCLAPGDLGLVRIEAGGHSPDVAFQILVALRGSA